jgi:hypothetical protein
MNNWMINVTNGKAIYKDFYIPRSENIAAKYGILNQPSISFNSENKKLGIEKGDRYILLDKKDNGEYAFGNFGHIVKVEEPIPLVPTEKEAKENKEREAQGLQPIFRFEHTLLLEIENRLIENNELDDYAYSLLSVDNVLRPELHFRHRLTRIGGFDYETITKGLIYISRTAFGRLANAMPVENKYDFLLYAIDRFGKLEFKDLDYVEAIELLQEYIEQNILSQGRYLVESYRIIEEELSQTGIPVNSIGFSRIEEAAETNMTIFDRYSARKWNAIKDVPDLLAPQAKYFKSLFYFEEQSQVINHLRESISMFRQAESRFRDAFAKHNWPIDMRN